MIKIHIVMRACFAGRCQQGPVCQFSREILGLPEMPVLGSIAAASSVGTVGF